MAKLKASCDQPLSDTLGISLAVRVPQLNCASGQPKIHEQQARWVQKNVMKETEPSPGEQSRTNCYANS